MAQDFNLQIKVRNAHLLRRMRALGIHTGAELGRRAGISTGEACMLIGLKRAPIRKTDGDYTAAAVKVCEALGVMPDEIWPRQIRDYQAPKQAPEVELSEEEVAGFIGQAPSSEDLLADKDAVGSLLMGLTARQERVLRLRYGIGGVGEHTLEEVAREFNLSRNRIREIEANAMRRLRHPTQIKKLGGPGIMERS